MDITLFIGETVVLLIDPRDTRDQGWIFSSDVSDVIFTIRETEDGDALLTLHGEVEKVGESVDDPGKVAVLIHSADTKDLADGEYWYDVTIVKTGHWFDITEYEGLYAKVDYGKIKDVNDVWMEIEEGWIELTDDTTNFLQITKAGAYKITADDYQLSGDDYVNYNLCRIITLNGVICDVFPFDDWFEEGSHSGLDFYYEAGYVLDVDNILQTVSGDHITLKDDITNFIEVAADGTVSSNITRFTAGSYPLYTAVTAASAITTVTKQENSFIFDDRDQFVRGDTYTPSVKSNVTITWTPTQVEE
jgi:hypothetical protein